MINGAHVNLTARRVTLIWVGFESRAGARRETPVPKGQIYLAEIATNRRNCHPDSIFNHLDPLQGVQLAELG